MMYRRRGYDYTVPNLDSAITRMEHLLDGVASEIERALPQLRLEAKEISGISQDEGYETHPAAKTVARDWRRFEASLGGVVRDIDRIINGLR